MSLIVSHRRILLPLAALVAIGLSAFSASYALVHERVRAAAVASADGPWCRYDVVTASPADPEQQPPPACSVGPDWIYCDECRVIILSGHPTQSCLKEKFIQVGDCVYKLSSTNPPGDVSCVDCEQVFPPGETRLDTGLLEEGTFVSYMSERPQEQGNQRPLVDLKQGPEAFGLAVARVLGLPLGDNDPTPAMAHLIKRWKEEDLTSERWDEDPLPREDWEPLVTAMTTGVDISRLSRGNAGDLNLDGEFGTVTRALGGKGHYSQIPEALLKEAVRLSEQDPEAAAALAKAALLLDAAGTVSFVPTKVRTVASSPNRFFQFVEVAQLTDAQAADLRRLAREMQGLAGIPQLKLMRLMDEIIAGDGPISDARLQEGARLSRELLLGKPEMMQAPQTAIDRISPVHEFLLLVKARNGEVAAQPVLKLVRTAQDRVDSESVNRLLAQALDLSGAPRQEPFIEVRE